MNKNKKINKRKSRQEMQVDELAESIDIEATKLNFSGTVDSPNPSSNWLDTIEPKLWLNLTAEPNNNKKYCGLIFLLIVGFILFNDFNY
jgi:hypothetical protein